MNVDGITAVLTGASGGIGLAVARELDKAGARLVLVGRNEARLAAMVAGLSRRSHVVQAADLSTAAGRAALLATCRQLPDPPGLLINCAGINELRLFEDQAEASIEQQLTINLLGPMLVCHDLLPLLRCRDEALIVNVGSTFGSIGYPGFSSYCAAKFGLRGFTEALRRELADTPVGVCHVAPRATRTALNHGNVDALNEALGTNVDSPQVVALEIARLVRSSRRGNACIGWPEKLFVRINSILPGLVDNALSKQLPVIRRFARVPKQ